MRRDQLEHAIRTACQIIGHSEVIVVGSQSILGSIREDLLPAEATMSIEVDILPIADDDEETARLADKIEGVAGEFSTFEEMHGFSIDGVDQGTSALPERVARPAREGAERQHRRPLGGTPVHRMVPRQGGPLRSQAVRAPGEGSQLRCRPGGARSWSISGSSSTGSPRSSHDIGQRPTVPRRGWRPGPREAEPLAETLGATAPGDVDKGVEGLLRV